MEKEKDRVEIKLNSPNNSYFSGQEISGQICFYLTKKTKIRAINLQLCGKGKCKWMEMFHKDSYGNVDTRHVFHTGKQVYVSDKIEVPYVPPQGIELAPGEVSMDFRYTLSKTLPSSFKGSYGSIKYKIKAVIQKPWTFDEKYTIPLTIVRYTVSPPITRINPPRPQICQTTRNISVFGSGPISLVAEFPKNFVVRNEKITLRVTVDNRSRIHVDKLRFTIVQRIQYRSIKPLMNTKVEEVVLFSKETGGVEKKSERIFAHDLIFPACPPSTVTIVLEIEYIINVEAILPAFYKNLMVSFNVGVYTSDGSLEPGNPFEDDDVPTGVGILPISNRLSSFISTNSPTHSNSLNASESSSLYSTTSESSTTTLSPAPRPPIHSGSIGRESIRNSFRSSMGYIQPNNSRQPNALAYPSEAHPMLAEYLTEIHEPPPMNSSYPPPNIPTMPHYLQSSVHFQVQARYPVNELPPSYEELFGRARSKSPTAPSPETPV